MSMQSYAIQAYGLYVPYETLKSNHDEDEFLEIHDSLMDIGAMDFTVDDLEDTEIHPITNTGNVDFNKILNEDAYILPCDKQPRLFNAPYRSKQEIADELKSSYSKYLPSDYDYLNNIVYGSYVTWG